MNPSQVSYCFLIYNLISFLNLDAMNPSKNNWDSDSLGKKTMVISVLHEKAMSLMILQVKSCVGSESDEDSSEKSNENDKKPSKEYKNCCVCRSKCELVLCEKCKIA